MKIVNNPNIFCMAAGLVVAKGTDYTYWNTADGFIFDLILKINEISVDDDIKTWFRRAETGQVQANPYWPRGSAMHTATFFINNGDFNIADFLRFFHETGTKDPVSDEDFQIWIAELPHILSYMKDKFINSPAWDAWCEIVKNRITEWDDVVKQAQGTLSDFYVQNAPEIIFSPNLLIHAYEANFVRDGDSIITIAYNPILESMLHEALHPEVSKHSDKIKALDKAYKFDGFADFTKMREYGYIQDFETQEEYIVEYLRVVEECIVRSLSTILAGGGVKRLAEHANAGFGSVPYIGNCFMESRPSVAQLGDFIKNVLCNFI